MREKVVSFFLFNNHFKIKDYDDDIYKGLFSQIETFQQETG